MKKQGWTSAILVSNPYHVRRGKWLFESNPGIEIQTAGAETPANPFYHFAIVNHEGLAWIGYANPATREKARAQPAD